MGRHSKQKGGIGSEALTHAERQALGYGTAKERLGKDSIKDYDACALCLQPVRDPVVTPDGVLYEREAILESLLSQKKALARAAAAFEAQGEEEARAAAAASAAAERAKLAAFHSSNAGGSGGGGASAGGATTGMAAFWIPAKTPEATARVDKPASDTLCPATGKKLRLKELTPVRFTPTPCAAEGEGRFMCPLCKEAFTNVSRIVVLRSTGDALGEECYRRFVEPEGTYEGRKVRPRDVVRLERGGTGFAATSKVEAETYTLLGVGSGLSDNRGQHAGGRSKFAGMRL